MLPLKLKLRTSSSPSRRQFLIGAAVAGAGLVRLASACRARAPSATAEPNPFNGYVAIAPDNKVTDPLGPHGHGPGLLSRHRHPGGRGAGGRLDQLDGRSAAPAIRSSMATSPGAAWRRAPAARRRCSRRSTATARPAPLARTMLVNAAAKQWNVPAGEIKVEKGVLSHASGKQATFGELADAAAQEPVPAEVALKAPRRLEGDRLGGLPPLSIPAESRPASSTTPST